MKRKEKQQQLRVNMPCPCCGEERHIERDTSLLNMQQQFTNQWLCKGEWAVDAAVRGKLCWACNRCLSGRSALAAHPERQNLTDFPGFYPQLPYLAYYDVTKLCSDCGRDFLFSSLEQQHWYEIPKFPVVVQANRCQDCRRIRRERAATQRDPHQLYHLVSLLLQVCLSGRM